MILYDPTLFASLVEFGILIPIGDSRAVRTYEDMKNHPRWGSDPERWQIDHIGETITREDLLRVHTPAYAEQLYGPL